MLPICLIDLRESARRVTGSKLPVPYPAGHKNLIGGLQRRIFILGALGYFNFGALLEGLRRLMSYKLGLHVLATFTEQIVPI